MLLAVQMDTLSIQLTSVKLVLQWLVDGRPAILTLMLQGALIHISLTNGTVPFVQSTLDGSLVQVDQSLLPAITPWGTISMDQLVHNAMQVTLHSSLALIILQLFLVSVDTTKVLETALLAHLSILPGSLVLVTQWLKVVLQDTT